MSKNDGTRMTWFRPAVSNPTYPVSIAGLLTLALALAPLIARGQSDAASAPESAASAATAPAPVPAQMVPAPITAAPVAAPTTLLAPPDWPALAPTQRLALAPLERDWNDLDQTRKYQWLEIAARFPTLPAEEQARLHERMRDWSRLSTAERQQARFSYQVAHQLRAREREAKWEAYMALPLEKRKELAEKAEIKQSAKPRSLLLNKTEAGPQTKSNLVPSAPRILNTKPVSPSVLQAKPGATTVLITQTNTPPAHQQAGQTKVFADPDLVDSKTLLPKRSAAAVSR